MYLLVSNSKTGIISLYYVMAQSTVYSLGTVFHFLTMLLGTVLILDYGLPVIIDMDINISGLYSHFIGIFENFTMDFIGLGAGIHAHLF